MEEVRRSCSFETITSTSCLICFPTFCIKAICRSSLNLFASSYIFLSSTFIFFASRFDFSRSPCSIACRSFSFFSIFFSCSNSIFSSFNDNCKSFSLSCISSSNFSHSRCTAACQFFFYLFLTKAILLTTKKLLFSASNMFKLSTRALFFKLFLNRTSYHVYILNLTLA